MTRICDCDIRDCICQPNEGDYRPGEIVTCTLVTGERAVGFYETTSPRTGSHLIKRVTVEGGQKADYAWATVIDQRFDNGLATSLSLV
jgi:hypothetical protein